MLSLNQQLINTDDVDASYSGTTAITAWFEGSRLHVCNVSATSFLFYSAARCSLTKRSLSLSADRSATHARCSASGARARHREPSFDRPHSLPQGRA